MISRDEFLRRDQELKARRRLKEMKEKLENSTGLSLEEISALLIPFIEEKLRPRSINPFGDDSC